MALKFDRFGNNNSRVDVGSAAMLDNLTTGTHITWCYRTGTSRTGNLWGKSTWHAPFFAGGTGTELIISRATQTLNALVSVANMNASYGLNKWICVAHTWNTAGVDSDQQVLVGDLATPVSGPVAYTTQRVGSGTVDTNAASSLLLGNMSFNDRSFEGDIAYQALYNRVLSMSEIRTVQYVPSEKLSGCVGMWHHGQQGTFTVSDLSGNGNHGAMTGNFIIAADPATSDLWLPPLPTLLALR